MNLNRIVSVLVLAVFVLGTGGALFIAACQAADTKEAPRDHPAAGVDVNQYCLSFAQQYASDRGLDDRAIRAWTNPESDLMRWASNLFSPAHSRFTAGYECCFEITDAETGEHKISVGLFLTGTKEFAEYTQWEKTQIIPITFVVDPESGRAGYGVFKYLDEPRE
ncbi:MAG: hypothetical protein OXB94_12350 [Nitrospira sp.]|nr:hypothetical protein [Nitrospira sp.]